MEQHQAQVARGQFCAAACTWLFSSPAFSASFFSISPSSPSCSLFLSFLFSSFSLLCSPFPILPPQFAAHSSPSTAHSSLCPLLCLSVRLSVCPSVCLAASPPAACLWGSPCLWPGLFLSASSSRPAARAPRGNCCLWPVPWLSLGAGCEMSQPATRPLGYASRPA